MAEPTRYFKNSLPDYNSNSLLKIDENELKKTINGMVNIITQNVQPSERNAEGGLYVGSIGIAYMLYNLSKSKLFSTPEKQEFIKQSQNYLSSSLSYAKTRQNVKSDISSFLLGNAGIYAIAAVLDQEPDKFIELYAKAASNCGKKDFLRCGGDELFVGRAGYISGALWLLTELKTEVVETSILHDLCKVIIQSGTEYSKARRLKVPLMYAYYNTEYLGAAHGLSSILLMLMSVPKFLEQNPIEANLIKKSVDYLLEIQTPSGNFPAAMGEADELLIHWCHGAPGVVYTLAKAYLVWKDTKYLDACVKCADLVWERGLLKKGPGICHGVAGSGYVFLLMFRLTNDQKYLYRAYQFGEFMKSEEFKSGANTPDCPYSLYEGLSGTVCFLADLAEPNQASFPFMNVFN